ncbi:MAG: hypothetical protein Q9227_000894 [Pyrenula ochraceoflavens]
MQLRTSAHGARPHAGLDPSRSSTGVIWCTERASEHGFLDKPSEWANLGQGAPEVDDDIKGCFPRPTSIPISENAREYGPTAGIKPLRAAVARLYNEQHRQGKDSKYTWENFSAIPIPLSMTDGYAIHSDIVASEIARGTSVIITSNPRNPTGHTTVNPELAHIQDICRDRATLIMDEFYSGYNYTTNCDGSTISAADNIVDVDTDDVLLIDGLTKRFRLPGWRVAWIVGPKEYIKALGSCGSYLDGGTNVPFQEAAVNFLDPRLVRHEMAALQSHFKAKRDYCLNRLRKIGYKSADDVPDATFYIWLDLTSLDPPVGHEAGISDGLNFFDKLLHEKTIVVPGIFFDLNPAKRRDLFDSPCHHFVRVSYGPKMDVLEKGMDGIENVVKKARDGFKWTNITSMFGGSAVHDEPELQQSPKVDHNI